MNVRIARRRLLASALFGAAAGGLGTQNVLAADAAETPGPARLQLLGRVTRPGQYQLNAKRRLTLKKLLSEIQVEGDPEELVVSIFEGHSRTGGDGWGELVIRVPLSAVLEDPEVEVYLETDYVVHVGDRRKAKPAKKDTRGL